MFLLDIPYTSFVITAILVILSAVSYWIKNRRILPGPVGLPYLGIYPFVTDENISSKLEEYKEQYGDMFSFTFTGRLYINLGSIKAMREVQLQKADCFADRYTGSNILVNMLEDGLLFVNGDRWKTLRKFFIQKFKAYGFNAVRDELAGPMYDSLNATIEDLKIQHKNPINIFEFLSQHCTITIRRIIFGEKGVSEEEISKMATAFSESAEGGGPASWLIIGPLAKFLLYTKPGFRKSLKSMNIIKEIILDCAKRIESSMNNDVPTCIVEEFYKERNERRRNDDSTWKYFTDEALVDSVAQFVADGIATVAGLLAGILNVLSDSPNEQEKLYSEIMDVIGPNRQPTVEDRPNLPYTNAFINEYMRTAKFLIYFPSLECTRETTVRGYKVPKGTITLLNFWSANHDGETFEDPDTFRPSRYLPSEGKPKAELPVLFGMGKRVCTGEPYVLLQSFLFITTIVQNFKVISSNVQDDKSVEFLVTGKLELTFVPRKET